MWWRKVSSPGLIQGPARLALATIIHSIEPARVATMRRIRFSLFPCTVTMIHLSWKLAGYFAALIEVMQEQLDDF